MRVHARLLVFAGVLGHGIFVTAASRMPYKEGVNVCFQLPVDIQTARFGPIEMEQLWNRGGATGGKGSTRRTLENGLK